MFEKKILGTRVCSSFETTGNSRNKSLFEKYQPDAKYIGSKMTGLAPTT